MRVIDAQQREKIDKEIEGRKMKKYNTRVNLRVTVHTGSDEKVYLMNVVNSDYLDDIRGQVAVRCGLDVDSKFKLIWLNLGGETVELTSQRVFWKYADTMWCERPWELHVQPEGKDAVRAISLHDRAKDLFAKYDENDNKKMDKFEFERMLLDLNLERLTVSPQLIHKFVQGEFEALDTDHSLSLTLDEFTKYVTDMTRWMRDELLTLANSHNAAEVLATRAMETRLAPVLVDAPPAGEECTTILHMKYGIRVEVPPGALPANTKLSISTLSPHAVEHLGEGTTKRGEFIFTPIVRVDYPSFEPGEEPPEAGSIDRSQVPYFAKPLTLIVPHCFDPRDGEESCVVLGSPHGGTAWESVHGVRGSDDTQVDHLKLVKDKDGTNEMRIMINYAGVYAGFTHPDIEDIAMVRIWLFSLPELPRDDSSALRVHMCPEVADQIDMMKLQETAEWGLSECVGMSKVIALPQGALIKFTYEGQEFKMMWMGSHTHDEFTIQQSDDKGEEPPEGGWPPHGDMREKLNGSIELQILEGMGNRAKRVNAVAKRAGFTDNKYSLPFSTWLRAEVRPDPPHHLEIKERTEHEFTITWKAPKALDGDGDGLVSEVTHYEIELQTTGPSGTYFAWRSLYCGPGHTPPDFKAMLREEYKKQGKTMSEPVKPGELLSKVSEKRIKAKQKVDEKKKAKAAAKEAGEKAGAPAADATDHHDDNSIESNKKAKKKKAKGKGKTAKPATPKEEVETATHSYTLVCSPDLFGRIRIRCWNQDIAQPSRYSEVLHLKRYMGETAPKSQELLDYESLRRHYYVDIHGGQETRIGPPASKNDWGGSPMPPPLPCHDPKKAKTLPVMAPVPYDVPALPKNDMIDKCADELVELFRGFGVYGGGAGLFCGLYIDHILHAVVGTPLGDDMLTPRRTTATLAEPLVLFVEVMYNDVLLPLCDSVVVMQDQWNYVDEKVAGMVAQIVLTGVQHYELCAKGQHLKECILVLHAIYEMMQQCEKDQTIACQLTDSEYSPALIHKLKAEMKKKMITMLWKLSNEVLEMILDIEDGASNDGRVAHEKHETTSLSQVARIQMIAHNNHLEAAQHAGGQDSSNCIIS